MKIRRILIFTVCAVAGGLTLRYAIQKFSLYGSISGHTVPMKEPLPAYTRALRPNYPYSIIPGGAYSTAELKYADQEDEVVKEHYSDFNVKKAQMVQLTEDKYQYASYRKKNKPPRAAAESAFAAPDGVRHSYGTGREAASRRAVGDPAGEHTTVPAGLTADEHCDI
jgi:hypothetical protein